MNFRTEHLTEGKIAVDEDRATLVFSPYAGRVIKLLAKPGDMVVAGQPLFVVEAPDMVQAQNDFIGAVAGLNKARSQLDLARIVENQNKSLYETRAVPLRDLQQAAGGHAGDAERSAFGRNLARSGAQPLAHSRQDRRGNQQHSASTGTINPLTTIYSPIAGTVVQRKVGPGQYVNYHLEQRGRQRRRPSSSAICPPSGWSPMCANPRPRMCGSAQPCISPCWLFRTACSPPTSPMSRPRSTPTTRRLMVRATLNNSEGLLKPEMFASVTILTGEGDSSPAVPREAVIYDGHNRACLGRARRSSPSSRAKSRPGSTTDKWCRCSTACKLGEKVVTKGSLFVDRGAARRPVKSP